MHSRDLDHATPLAPTRVPGVQKLPIVAAAISAIAIGVAIQFQDGEYTPWAMVSVTVALIAAVLIFVRPYIASIEKRGSQAVISVLGIGIAIQFAIHANVWPISVDQRFIDTATRLRYLSLLSGSAILVILGVADFKTFRRWWFPALLFSYLLLTFWMVRVCPDPHIDVWVFQQQGPAALLHGRNPYDADQVKFPDIYHSTAPGAQEVYGPGMSARGRLRFGFPYPPLSLLLSTLGYRIGGDCRYAQAVALVLAGLFVGYSRPGRVAKLSAVLLMFTPRVLFVLGRAWTEPFVVMLLAATVFCAARRLWGLLPIALGLFLASKQYSALAVPFTFLLLREPFDGHTRSWLRWAGLLVQAAVVAMLVSLPLALWDWHKFWFSTVTVQQKAPFRWDALSYLVFLGFRNSRYTTWTWLLFVFLIPAMALAVRKARRDAAGFAAAVGLVFLVFFAFNKQAFCNYYFFTIGAFCCAAASKEDDKVTR